MASSSVSNLSLTKKENASLSMINILDPESQIVIKWIRLMFILGVINLITDLLFLYIPYAKGPLCIGFDFQAGIVLSIFRTILDSFHIFHMIFKFRTALPGTGPKLFNRSTSLIKDPRLIAINYLKSSFIIDLVAVLPLPQKVILQSKYLDVGNIVLQLSSVIMLQFGPRMVAMVPWHSKTVRSVSIPITNIWSGAIYNLLLFIVSGHFFGACYYASYLNRLQDCLVKVLKVDPYSPGPVLDCGQVHKECISKYTGIEHGMLSDAFANEIGSRSFIQKFIYSFVWGVRSLSSLGQIFDASFNVTETTFSCMVMIIGLVLLADLIARMQTSVQSAGARREKQRLKQRKLEEWTHYHQLPPHLKGLVRQSATSEWQGTKGIDDEAILNTLPHDLQRDIRTHLYKERVLNTPPFSKMDEQLLDFICGHLRTLTRAEGTYIVLQGDPLDQVVFIFTGLLQLTTHHGSGRSNSRNLEAGDFFGDDLLTWASQPNLSTQNLPHSNVTVKCISNVEAFCLPAEHLRLLVVFNYIHRFQHALREHHA